VVSLNPRELYLNAIRTPAAQLIFAQPLTSMDAFLSMLIVGGIIGFGIWAFLAHGLPLIT